MKKSLLILALTLASYASSWAQNPQPQAVDPARIELSDGRILYPKALRREKDTIIATLEIPPQQPGGPTTRGDFGFALKDIYTLYFPKPQILDTAPTLISTGKAQAALTQIEEELKFYTMMRDAPGSWWDELVPLQLQALLALKKEKEAADAATLFSTMATAPENKLISKAFVAVARTRKGEHEASLQLYNEAYKATKRADILGLIAVNKGDSLVAIAEALHKKGEIEKAKQQFEAALLSYLRIPALYPTQKQYLPQSAIGAARTYFGMEDFDRALTTIKEIRENFPGTPEAAAADELEPKVRKRKEQLADPKAAAEAAATPAAS